MYERSMNKFKSWNKKIDDKNIEIKLSLCVAVFSSFLFGFILYADAQNFAVPH